MCYDYSTVVSLETNFYKIEREKHIMKKKLAVLLALALSVTALAACGAEEATSESSTELTEFTPSIELVKVDGDVSDLSALPVEDYVTLGDYKNATLNVSPKQEVTDEMVETTLIEYFYQHGAYYLTSEDFADTEGTVADTNFVLIDYEGKKDGVAFDGGTATDTVLGIGSGMFIEGFESGLVGTKVGETVELNLTFPENYGNEELAGQPVVFTVTVKGLLTLDDDTIKKFEFPEIETVEDYRAETRAMLEYEAESAYMNELSAVVYRILNETCPVSKIPESTFNRMKTQLEEQVVYEASYYDMDAEEYAKAISGMSVSDYASSMAEGFAAQAVIFQAVANAEGLEVTQEDMDAFVQNFIEMYGPNAGIDSVEAFYEKNNIEDVRDAVLQEKVIEFMAENAIIVEE